MNGFFQDDKGIFWGGIMSKHLNQVGVCAIDSKPSENFKLFLIGLQASRVRDLEPLHSYLSPEVQPIVHIGICTTAQTPLLVESYRFRPQLSS
jgi:hypothetical protein